MHVATMNPFLSQSECPAAAREVIENGKRSCKSKQSGRCYHLEESFTSVKPFMVIKVKREMKQSAKSSVKEESRRSNLTNEPTEAMKEAAKNAQPQPAIFTS